MAEQPSCPTTDQPHKEIVMPDSARSSEPAAPAPRARLCKTAGSPGVWLKVALQ